VVRIILRPLLELSFTEVHGARVCFPGPHVGKGVETMLKQRLSYGWSRLAVGVCLAIAPVALFAQTAARQSGTVKSNDGKTLVVTKADGTTATVPVADDAVVEQLAPGVTDMKTAVTIKLSDIIAGDKVITGKNGDSDTASRVIVIKSSDIAARNQAEQADWQKRGTSGLVKTVDGANLTVSVGARTVMVSTTPKTVFRKYAGDSVKFQDATAGTLADIHPGDQLSVRGDKSPDGSSVTAEEVVTGTFSNLSGLLTAVDASAGTITFKDLTTKKPVTVKITANSDVRSLPAQFAQGFATRGAGGAGGPGGGQPGGGAPGGGAPGGGASGAGGPGGAGRTRSAGMDLSRMLPRLPKETVAALHPKDAVMVVASPSGADSFTAITVLSGVETLLTAPAGSAPITLSPWSIGGGGGGEGPQ
jgi:hypothetical protein